MRHRKLQFSFLAAAALSASAALIACSADQAPLLFADEAPGSVDFSLQIAPGVTLDSVSYAIVGPASFSKSGSIDLSQSTQIGALMGPLPAGQGYSITLTGTSVEGTSSCSGSALFDVVAHQTTPVAVAFSCHEGPRTGSALVNGVLNICPSLDAVSANPAEVLVGTQIALSATAHDPDAGPAALSYHWTSNAGSLSNAAVSNPNLTCLVPGPVTLSVSASDADPLASCADTRSITVQCSAPGGGAGGSSAGGGTSAGGTSAGGTSAGGTSAGGTSAGGTSAGDTSAGGTSVGGTSAGGTSAASGGSSGSGGATGSGTAGGSTGGIGGSAGAGGSASEHLVIYRVGDGAGGLTNTGNPVIVDEYTTAGSLLRSIPMPLAVSGTNRRLVASGTATSEGLLTRSSDGHFVLLTGYDAPLPTSGLAGTASTAVARIVGRISADGTVDTSTQLPDGATANNPRSVASTDGSQIWFTGGSGGVRFLTFGNTGATTQLSTTVVNLRQVNIFGSQLFVSDSSQAVVRLGAVGTGLPTTAGQTISNVPGFPVITSPSNNSPYAFYFADVDATVPGLDVLYVTDDTVGLTKYSLVAGSWVAKGTVGTAADVYRGLTATVNAGLVTLYAIRKGGGGATGGGEFVSLVDASGYNGTLSGTPTLLATASANTAFRGVALAPIP